MSEIINLKWQNNSRVTYKHRTVAVAVYIVVGGGAYAEKGITITQLFKLLQKLTKKTMWITKPDLNSIIYDLTKWKLLGNVKTFTIGKNNTNSFETCVVYVHESNAQEEIEGWYGQMYRNEKLANKKEKSSFNEEYYGKKAIEALKVQCMDANLITNLENLEKLIEITEQRQ